MHEDNTKSNVPADEQQVEEGMENVEDQEDVQQDSPEKIEEQKLRSKFPQAARGPPSAFLQKRLQQRKFFDSGDYNMAKAKGLKLPVVPPRTMESATPPVSKQQQPQQQQQQSAAEQQQQPAEGLSVTVEESSGGSTSPTGTEIPTPEKIPARKTSIVHTSGASKLSPHPHLVHHSPTSVLEVEDAPSNE